MKRPAPRKSFTGPTSHVCEWDSVPAFPAFGIHVRDGQVYSGAPYEPVPLGLAAGAKAVLTGGTRPSLGTQAAAAILAGPAGLLMALGARRAVGFIIFADGHLYEHELPNEGAIDDAQADSVRFNALTGVSG